MLEPSINRTPDSSQLNDNKSLFNEDESLDHLLFEDEPIDAPKPLDRESKDLVEPRARSLAINPPKFGLRKKATAWAIALSTLPIMLVGSIAYYFANQSLTKQVLENEKSTVVNLNDKIELFIGDRYRDAKSLTNLEIFANPKISQSISPQEKNEFLTQYVGNEDIYDRIAVFDLNGNVIAQSEAKDKFGQSYNHSQNSSFHQKIINTKSVVFLNPYFSNWTKKMSMEIGAPLQDKKTGALIGLVRMRFPVEVMDDLLDQYQKDGKTVFLVDGKGQIFLSNQESLVKQNIKQKFPNISQDIGHEAFSQITSNQVVTQAHVEELEESPYNLDWKGVVITPSNKLFEPQQRLLLTLLGGTTLMAALVSLLTAYLVNRSTKFLEETTNAVQQIGQGDLDTVLPVTGNDERAILAGSINQMSGQIKDLLSQKQYEAERYQLIKEITTKLGKYPQTDLIFNLAITEIRHALAASRVIVYLFDLEWKGSIVAESVADGYPKALGAQIADPCFADRYVEKYREGRVQATPNICEAGLTACHLKQLEPFGVKANLVAPIVLGEERQLLGLLVAHQCDAPRLWSQNDIDLFSQLAIQVGFAVDRANSLEQQKQGKERLQSRALELLMEVDPISQGDLTIRAKVTEDEIGTIADSYNAMVASLRKVVTQVQETAQQMTSTTSSNQELVQDLSDGAIRQTIEIDQALQRIQEMSASIRKVSSNVQQAAIAVKQATATVAAGDASLNRTVEGILAIQQTVTDTSTKVQQLGIASEKISKVVGVISGFAEQTNLLALNAAIEAARAGEEGRGFAVVADEVGNLARQSSAATVEIENIIEEIQKETKELVAAMAIGNREVLKGTQLADETRQNLNKIVEVSNYIEQLVQEIAQTTVTQSVASESVAQSMTDVAAISNQTSQEAANVSTAFQDLLSLAEQLQASAGQFKVS
ncbi:methyl-accepting chemotaxis protein [Merismopedia glauca]|uniref:Chemotaxis protein n=1 Tax=Merismopedia glauca CCAP 1448/3 TaxID=1296344 RepID=A0A2T1C5V2_9CYAN|nr:methyl-accepting chemotaxis protein [Merismopedia glauca]PSB03641.1 chemotaxis protein [Merismopedia glauca CCAP 1448/3]